MREARWQKDERSRQRQTSVIPIPALQSSALRLREARSSSALRFTCSGPEGVWSKLPQFCVVVTRCVGKGLKMQRRFCGVFVILSLCLWSIAVSQACRRLLVFSFLPFFKMTWHSLVFSSVERSPSAVWKSSHCQGIAETLHLELRSSSLGTDKLSVRQEVKFYKFSSHGPEPHIRNLRQWFALLPSLISLCIITWRRKKNLFAFALSGICICTKCKL